MINIKKYHLQLIFVFTYQQKLEQLLSLNLTWFFNYFPSTLLDYVPYHPFHTKFHHYNTKTNLFLIQPDYPNSTYHFNSHFHHQTISPLNNFHYLPIKGPSLLPPFVIHEHDLRLHLLRQQSISVSPEKSYNYRWHYRSVVKITKTK